MKKVLLLVLLLFFCSVKTVEAHNLGQPPYLKINDKYVGYYPLQIAGITASALDIPQDIAPENYTKEQPITFFLDISQLGIPTDLAAKATFQWDFGDGTKATGITNTHTYKTIGSKVLTIFISQNQQTNAAPQLLETVFLNILPNSSYHLPKAVILVNGKQDRGKPTDHLLFDFNNALSFDASHSIAPSSQIVSYAWDFGDGKTLNKAQITYRYKLPQFFSSPILRVRDKNGFIADTYVNLQNSGKNDANSVNPDDNYKEQTSSFSRRILAVGSIVIIIFGICLGIFLKKTKTSSTSA